MALRILSLFDGMSCGRIALDRLGIECEYYASEIEEAAIKTSSKNYPDIIHLGDVTKIDFASLPQMDLIMGGSPCQSFSSIGDGTGFEGKSGLFYDYVRAVHTLKPKYFLLENVMMKKQWRDEISACMGVEPIMIDSKLVSGQNRKRLYWTNIPFDGLPEDKGIFIEDVLEKNPDPKYWLPEKSVKILTNKVNMEGAPDPCCIDVYNKRYKTDRKSPTLTHPGHCTLRIYQDGRYRKMTELEYERLQTVPEGYTDGLGLSYTHRGAMMGNGWTVDVIAHIFKGLMK